MGDLFVDTEAAIGARIGAAAGQVQPVALIAIHIVIDQLRFKPCRPSAPVALQLMNQKASDILAHSIR